MIKAGGPLESIDTEGAWERDRLTELDGAEDRKDQLFGEPVVDGDVADGTGDGEADAGGEKCGSEEFHGRVYKVGPGGERDAALLTEEPRYM